MKLKFVWAVFCFVVFSLFSTASYASDMSGKPVDAMVAMVNFEDLEVHDFAVIPDPLTSLRRAVQHPILSLNLAPERHSQAELKLYDLLGPAGYHRLKSELMLRARIEAARQVTLARRGGIVLAFVTFVCSFLAFTYLAARRLDTQEFAAPGSALSQKRLAERHRAITQESLGFLLCLRDCLIVSTGINGELKARRLIERPRLKLIPEQIDASIAWIKAAREAGQDLEFASPQTQSQFEDLVLWARQLRYVDANRLGLVGFRKAALDLDKALKTTAGTPDIVHLPLYKLPEHTRRLEPLRLAS